MNRDPENVMHMLALGMATRYFGDLIADGVGTQEQFANLYLRYYHTKAGRHAGMGVVALELRGALNEWLNDRMGQEQEPKAPPTIRELKMPLSPDQME